MRFHLPSGAMFVPDPADTPWTAAGLFAAEARKIRGSVHDSGGAPLAPPDLTLRDFHTVRAIARRLGWIEEAQVPIVCDNCGTTSEVRPSATLELAPYRDGECHDPELDAPFDFGSEQTIALRGPVSGSARAIRLRLEQRSMAQAAPLHVALARPQLRFTSTVVRAMGVVALDDLSDERRIARRLEHAPDPVFEAVATLFEQAHYPARLDTPHSCPHCGAVSWMPCPAEREFSMPAAERERATPEEVDETEEPFFDVDEFERLVRRVADRVYPEMGIKNVDLVVSEGPAACDEGGTPLLASYLPGDPDAPIPSTPEVTLYYRTFASMWREEGEFDIEREVDDTIRHELEHHLGFLAGDDPMDDAEREIIADEYRRRVGRQEAGRRAVRAELRSLRDFLRVTWWLWLLALAGGWAIVAGARC